RFEGRDHAAVAASLREVGFHSAVELLSTYVGRARDLKPWLVGAEINLDRNLRLQYLAGLGLNSTAFPDTYRDLVSRRAFPPDLFAGSPTTLEALKSRLLLP